MKKTGLYKYVYDFSVDYDNINADDILDIYNYLMKKHHIKCLDLMKGFLLDFQALEQLEFLAIH